MQASEAWLRACAQPGAMQRLQRLVVDAACPTRARPARAGLEARLKALAAKRSLADLSVGPVLTWTNERMKAHMDRLLQIPGARLGRTGACLGCLGCLSY